MKLTLLDYNNCSIEHDIPNENEIDTIILIISSGDEIAKVYYNNGDIKKFDSSKTRYMDLYDGEYIIYNKNINLLNDENWLNRFDSYEYLHK